jgi:hypothetical protein
MAEHQNAEQWAMELGIRAKETAKIQDELEKVKEMAEEESWLKKDEEFQKEYKDLER